MTMMVAIAGSLKFTIAHECNLWTRNNVPKISLQINEQTNHKFDEPKIEIEYSAVICYHANNAMNIIYIL